MSDHSRQRRHVVTTARAQFRKLPASGRVTAQGRFPGSRLFGRLAFPGHCPVAFEWPWRIQLREQLRLGSPSGSPSVFPFPRFRTGPSGHLEQRQTLTKAVLQRQSCSIAGLTQCGLREGPGQGASARREQDFVADCSFCAIIVAYPSSNIPGRLQTQRVPGGSQFFDIGGGMRNAKKNFWESNEKMGVRR